MRRLLYVVPVLVFAAIGVGLAVGLTRDPGTLPSALLEKPVPEFELPGLDGGEGLSSGDLKGQVSLVNVFASWCVPCRVEHPVLMQLAESGVPIYGINYKDPADQAQAWLAELGDPFEKIGADRSGRVGIEWGVYGVPETFVVDAEGRIRHRHVGPLQARDLEGSLLPILSELRR